MNSCKVFLIKIGLFLFSLSFSFSHLVGQSGSIGLDFQTTNPSACDVADGIISLQPTGGTPPYAYSIDGGASFQADSLFTGLSIGTYILHVRDDNQQFSSFLLARLTVEGAPIIRNVVVSNPMTCNEGGSIKIVVEGERGGLAYSIDGGNSFQSDFSFLNISEGTYDIVVRNEDGTCPATYPTITFDPLSPADLLQIQITTTNADCDSDNGVIEVNVSGGSGQYLYSIDNAALFQTSNIFSDLAAGSYAISIMDTLTQCANNSASSIEIVEEGCPDCEDIEIIVATTHPTCDLSNGEINISIQNGQSTYEYSIDDGQNFQSEAVFTNLSANDYIIKIRDIINDCERASSQPTQLISSECPECDSVLDISAASIIPDCDSLNGQISLTIENGSGDYVVRINDGVFGEALFFDDLGQGNFSFIVRDIGQACQADPFEVSLVSEVCDSICPDIRLNGDAEVLLFNCEANVTYCFLGVTAQALETYQIFDNGLPYQGPIGVCDSILGAATIELEGGVHDITITIPNTDCTYEFELSTFCLTDTIRIDTTVLLGESDTLCFPAFFGQEVESIQLVCEGLTPFVGFEINNVDKCIIYEGLEVGIDSVCVVVCFEDETCVEVILTVETITEMEAVEEVFDTIFVNEMDTFCIDTSVFEGMPVSIINYCEEASGESVVFDIDSSSYCVIYTGIEPGTEMACIEVCDDLGICDTTIIIITVELEVEPPIAINDIDTVQQKATKTLNVLGNDTTNSTILTLTILDQTEANGVFEVNADLTVTYTPSDTLCDLVEVFTYELCNPAGCDTAIVELYIECKIFRIYNGISPNGDGINDTFTIEGIEHFPDNTLRVINRWGNVVYEQQGYKGQWDGTWNNQDLPDGTYFYLFDNGKGQLFSGTLLIKR